MSHAESGTDAAILLVDDEPRNLVALEAALAGLDFTIMTARSGEECLRTMLRHEFAVVLLDVQMPGLDGIETATMIRSRPRNRTVPIIFVTAFDQSEERITRGYQVGAVDFLFKPVQPVILRAKVAMFVELYRKTKEIEVQAEQLRAAERRELEQRLAESHATLKARAAQAQVELERKANERVQLLARVATSLLATQEPRTFLAQLAGWLVDQLELRSCLFYARSDAPDVLALAGAAGDEGRALLPATLRGESVAWVEALLRRHMGPLVGEDRPSFLEALPGMIAAFPIAIGNEVLGVMILALKDAEIASDDFVAPMELVCDQVAMALHRERLVETLRQRTEDLANADARKDEFLAMLGHELRNPLASLRYALELSRLPGDAGHDAPDLREVFARQLRPLQRLVDDLLDVSRISQGKLSLQHGPISIADILAQAVEQCAPLFSAKGHACIVEPLQERIEMMADGVRLTQVLVNLLHNAARYTDRGGRIHVAVAREGDDALIRVQDNGRGVPPEMLARIFELFVQADRTRDPIQGGLGLGLTLVRRLVELHRGVVSATSDGPGCGSTFTVRIPIIAPQVDSHDARATTSASALGLDLVIVEDNEDARDLLQAYLTRLGHRVRVAHDGPSGLACLRESPPAIAFIDVGLPGLDGYELARRFRESCPDVSTRLLALSGYGQDADRRRALAAGFDQHLVKPVLPTEIERVLREATRLPNTDPS